MFAKLRELDFYRKIPKDLTETTTHGSILSICAATFMLILFIAELWSFLSMQVVTNVIIDPNTDSLLRINFNITVMDMPCEFAMIDVVDVLGTRKDNITKNINKWQVDANGVRKNYEGRNTEQRDLLHDVHHDMKVLTENGVHAVPVDEKSFENWLSSHHYTFVNFYAPWCIWCQRLEPVWEAFAERIENEQLPISIVKVDCVANQNLCMSQHIQAFPTLRIFKDTTVQPPDYRSDRTTDALLEFVRSRLATDEQVAQMSAKEQEEHKERQEQQRDDHPGCMMSGFLLVNRVPGNFHLEARSKHHNLNPKMANLSHVVNHLSFGPVLSRSAIRRMNGIPESYFSMDSTHPMDGNVYVNGKLHQAFHHHIKVTLSRIYIVISCSSVRWLPALRQSITYLLALCNVPSNATTSYECTPSLKLLCNPSVHMPQHFLIFCSCFFFFCSLSVLYKVVSTHLEVSSRYSGKDAILAYQLVQSSQVMQVSSSLDRC
jgi:protein disulfide-isomerase-like protein